MKMTMTIIMTALILAVTACNSTPPEEGVSAYDLLIEQRGPEMEADRLELVVTRRNQLARKAGLELIEIPTFEGDR